MRIERLDKNKIKIVIGNDDIRMWNVDLKNFTDNTPEAQDMFWFALKRAEQDVNFTVGKAQLLVETIQLGEEGFAMLVSRLENEEELAEALLKMGKQVRHAEVKTRRKRGVCVPLRIFKFGDFEDVCRGVWEIREAYLGTSKLWKYNGEFYLELMPVDSFGIFETENILSEFSEKDKRPIFMQGVLNEHGKLLIESDAVAVIAQNFA
ncbi:MAG: adaptor protein MecA [Clostridia bacterium]|nr:adaptor protein MecA [Clostridia bacterium]